MQSPGAPLEASYPKRASPTLALGNPSMKVALSPNYRFSLPRLGLNFEKNRKRTYYSKNSKLMLKVSRKFLKSLEARIVSEKSL